jgi:glutamate---cysteine ligase / carboxylate-amine ligase
MPRTLRLFEGYGVELEYMIVRADTLDVYPIADELLREVAGSYESEVEFGDIAWSNELALHVIEFKTNGPASSLGGLDVKFQDHVQRVNAILKAYGGRLMPGAMHPWMDPFSQMMLWPHEYNPIYEAYNRIFDCRGHGWSNLQSTHINLPFSNDEEFARLHAAIRLLMPLMPALTAASPVIDGRSTGISDNRLAVYRTNSVRIPSVSGQVIPEPVYSRADYEGVLLQGIYDDIKPYDPEGILQYEWLNSRGSIARFDRMAIEIRILDIQECPAADLATTSLICRTLKAITEQRWASLHDQKGWDTNRLNRLLINVSEHAGSTVIDDSGYLKAFGIGEGRLSASEFWAHITDEIGFQDVNEEVMINSILKNGTLSERISRSLGSEPEKNRIFDLYQKLCDCLESGIMFKP